MFLSLKDIVFQTDHFYKAIPCAGGGTYVFMLNPSTGNIEREKTKTDFKEFRKAFVKHLDEADLPD